MFFDDGVEQTWSFGMSEVLKLRVEMIEGDYFAEIVLYVFVSVQRRSRSLLLYLFDDTAESIYDAMAGQNVGNSFHDRQQNSTVPVSSQSWN